MSEVKPKFRPIRVHAGISFRKLTRFGLGLLGLGMFTLSYLPFLKAAAIVATIAGGATTAFALLAGNHLRVLEVRRDGFRFGRFRARWEDVESVEHIASLGPGQSSRDVVVIRWKTRPWWSGKELRCSVMSADRVKASEVARQFAHYQRSETQGTPPALADEEGGPRYRVADESAIPPERLAKVLRDPKQPTKVRVRAAEALRGNPRFEDELQAAHRETVSEPLQAALREGMDFE